EPTPSEGFHSSAKEPKTTYVPANLPQSGGRAPSTDGSPKPAPLTVTRSPETRSFVFDTVMVGVGAGCGAGACSTGQLKLTGSTASPAAYMPPKTAEPASVSVAGALATVTVPSTGSQLATGNVASCTCGKLRGSPESLSFDTTSATTAPPVAVRCTVTLEI